MAKQVGASLGDPLATAIASAAIAMDLYARGRFEEASLAFATARHGYRQSGDLAPWGGVSAYLSLTLTLRGKLAESLAIGIELETVGHAAQDRRLEATGAHCVAGALLCGGELQAGFLALERSIARYRAIPDHHLVASALGDLAKWKLREGDTTAAAELVEEGKRIAREHQLRGWLLTPLLAAEAGLLVAGVEAGSKDARAFDAAARVCRKLTAQARLHTEALPPAKRALGELEWRRGNAERARAAWDESIAAARSIGAVIEELETHKMIARHSVASSSREAVEAIQRQLRAELRGAPV
ncbi:MAG: hypothetical protein AUH85_18445 [Chloroflexi bacterium 13_1_40CM_4_68_4]|nr:MAG: hypothetical protein AUH85_18445 [Chloroflexi bacterium 13_1_40CM_4_68_4]